MDKEIANSGQATTLGSQGVIEAFRKLREAWFVEKLLRKAHGREWESEEEETIRDSENEELKVIYDQQTELIIQGQDDITKNVEEKHRGVELQKDGAEIPAGAALTVLP